MKNINTQSKAVSFQLTDFEGNRTWHRGLNDLKSINELMEFLQKRKEFLNPLLESNFYESSKIPASEMYPVD